MGGVAVPDSAYITATVPDGMREGMDVSADVARPTGMAVSTDDTIKVEEGTRDGEPIMRVRLPRPAHIPAGPPKLSPALTPDPEKGLVLFGAKSLHYYFPLFPGVQCRVSLEGEASFEHLEQLIEVLNVQARKMREQAERPTKTNKKVAKPDAD